MGRPLDDMDDYDLYEDNGIKVYVRVDIMSAYNALKISYKKLLFSGALLVEGVAV